MNNSPLISVVLPTYNVAQYLRQCLESVAAQTYRNIEVIIIIDGATDGSYEIAKEFCKTDDRFSVYWQENQGSGPARNAGLAHCRGELVMFVDPDDWIEPELLEKLYEAQREGDYDLTASRRNFVTCDLNGHIIRTHRQHYADESIEGQQEVRMAYMRMLEMGVVNNPTQKLYKLALIRTRHIDFPPLRRSQDVAFNYRYYHHIRSLRTISYSGYNYRMVLQHASKTPPDYGEIIRRLYTDCQTMYAEWGIPFPEQEMCNFFFRSRLYPHLQKAATQGWNIAELVEDAIVWHITKTANPKPWYLKVTRNLILSHSYMPLKWFLRFIRFFKSKVLRASRVQGELR
ncbi:MAG: glycosyltransferase [Bacteroidaceae bacterium]|nr:glycosyltransferase [Bacteroidaceae bacterium]